LTGDNPQKILPYVLTTTQAKRDKAMRRTTRRQKIARQNAIAVLVALSAVLTLWTIAMVAFQGV